MSIYLPKKFEVQDVGEALSIIGSYPLATVISDTSDGPFVSHLPLVAEESKGTYFLFGHLARANLHAKLLNGRTVYAIFHGPQTYITPTWYAENDVPTWNYAVIHVQGSCKLIEDREGVLQCLEKLTNHAERNEKNRWNFWVPDDLSGQGLLEQAIVGFKIEVEKFQSKFKLSQNRSLKDRRGIIQGLSSRQDEISQQVRNLMLAMNEGAGS